MTPRPLVSERTTGGRTQAPSPPVPSVGRMSPDELVAAACPTIADLGGSFYFIPETVAKGKEHGLDGLRFYFLGRGGVLGDTSAEVVASAFGYFNPGLVTKMWNTGREKLSPTAAAELYWAACADAGRARFAGIEGLDGFVAAAEAVVAAAAPSGLALYSGIRRMPLSDDAPGRAMQLIAVLREFRGSAHLVAVRSVGLDDVHAHFAKRPDMIEGFGWQGSDADAVTDEDRRLLQEAETVTDRIVRPAFAVLGDAEQRALLDGLERMRAATAAR